MIEKIIPRGSDKKIIVYVESQHYRNFKATKAQFFLSGLLSARDIKVCFVNAKRKLTKANEFGWKYCKLRGKKNLVKLGQEHGNFFNWLFFDWRFCFISNVNEHKETIGFDITKIYPNTKFDNFIDTRLLSPIKSK